MSGIMTNRIDRLAVSDRITILKNGVIEIENADGSLSQLGLAELANLDNLGDELALLAGLTATAAELNQAADISAKHVALTAATTLGADDNGQVSYLNAAGGFTVTLPAPALGLEFEFRVQAAPSGGAYNIATNGGADIIAGSVQEAPSATGPVDQNADNIQFADGVALLGDWVKVVCDGTNWHLSGMVQANNAVVLSTT